MKTASPMVRRRVRFAAAVVPLALSLVLVASPGAQTTRMFKSTRAWSEFVTMRDGVKLAVDIHLPEGLAPGERTATILHMTRYYRSVAVRSVYKLFAGTGVVPITELDLREPMVKAGYSWVDVDIRGAGASYGHHDYPLSQVEVRDGADLIDWIVTQPWASGAVGTTGASYNGSMAMMLLGNRHPALKAVVPRSSGWDMYEDIWLPGGVPSHPFLNAWSRLIESFDRNRFPDVFGWSSGLAFRSVRPVNEAELEPAIAQHARNVNAFRLLSHIVYKDDPLTPPLPVTIENFSPHTTTPPGVPIYFYTGWFDGAIVRGQIRGFLALANAGGRLRLGPWFHGGEFNASPFARRGQRPFDHAAEVIRFFDQHLRGIDSGAGREAPVQYYTMGREEWRGSNTWPPPGATWQSWYFDAARAMTTTPATTGEAEDSYRVDPAQASPPGSRWGLVVGTSAKRGYTDRRRLNSGMTYTTPVLSQALEVTGHPRVRLFVASDASDGAVFAYLEDVAPNGRVTYVTEGQLRLIHRQATLGPDDVTPVRSFRRADARDMVPGQVTEVVLDLLPTSYEFPAGHRIRLAITGHDAANFSQPYPPQAPLYRFHRDQLHPSRLELPVFAAKLVR
jgi:putative CocE/NonD family hydrolase